MLGKLLKNDLKRNMRWLWILFVSTILLACITRGCKALGQSVAFFQIIGILFDSIFYALAVNIVLQPFLRNFMNFTKSFYSDESYLTHTLPVTKNQLINSKFLTALIEISLGFITLIISLLIMYYSPTMLETLKVLLSLIVVGEFSVLFALTLFVMLVFVEFFMFISIIYLSIVVSYRAREKRVLKTFITTAILAFVSLTVLSIAMVVVLLINGVQFTSEILVLSSNAFMSVLITGIVVYSAVCILFYFLTKKEFNKGVNVD